MELRNQKNSQTKILREICRQKSYDASLLQAKKNPNFFSKKILKIFRIFRKLFGRFVRSKNFPEIGRAETIRLVQKSSKSEPSPPFFGRLKFRESLSRTSSFKIFYADTK